MYCKKCKETQGKYELACAAADTLHNELCQVRIVLEHRVKALIQGKALVDRLMGVAEENERLKARIAELEALVTGTEPPRHNSDEN